MHVSEDLRHPEVWDYASGGALLWGIMPVRGQRNHHARSSPGCFNGGSFYV